MTTMLLARQQSEGGYAMAALLVGLAVMGVVLGVALPMWQTAARREREAELIFRGEQYARAVALYQRSRGAFPPSVDVLVEERFLRKRYADPMTEDGEFQVIYVGQALPGQAGSVAQVGRGGGRQTGAAESMQQGLDTQVGGVPTGAGVAGGAILGVVSKSTQTSLRLYNGRNVYSEWAFVAVQATQQGGAIDGTAVPAGPGLGQGRGDGGAGPALGGFGGRGARGGGRGAGDAGGRGGRGAPNAVPLGGRLGQGQPR